MTKKNDVVKEEQKLQIDTRLTRGEIIDMMIEDTIHELEREVNELQNERQKLTVCTFDEIKDIFSPDHKCVLDAGHFGYTNVSRQTVVRLEIEVTDDRFLSRVERIKEIDRRTSILQKLLSDFQYNRGKAKNVILRKLLSASPEGLDLLNQIDGYRKGMRNKLIDKVNDVMRTHRLAAGPNGGLVLAAVIVEREEELAEKEEEKKGDENV